MPQNVVDPPLMDTKLIHKGLMLQNRSHPLNPTMGISEKWCFHYDIGNNNGLLAILYYVVYATLGITRE
jgi:hypothetical protein